MTLKNTEKSLNRNGVTLNFEKCDWGTMITIYYGKYCVVYCSGDNHFEIIDLMSEENVYYTHNYINLFNLINVVKSY